VADFPFFISKEDYFPSVVMRRKGRLRSCILHQSLPAGQNLEQMEREKYE
jgi:hypothetical protein